ncbi:ABC transporter ATP-binding protein [Roseovarius sp. LXJ103]|uniref:ABC transporter ATP-binding protein n=1 Tax=Roseovarius carneus TaxID=2853164 RepID=UPI000D61AD9B|nr:ABC transporter ATP-binding protein [Roseovarius carneus]MBZ8117404.1 ABC transporter ATP-binding protein [Roseovarius carneus]PWE36782.1 spermidine/putrescine ABC transporter ATP-binding protein [Pelagicola sp. LXJ1103]
MSVLLSLQSVSKRFGDVRAVEGVTLDILENEFFALLGASGSGKTTLLRMLAGFEGLSAGDILLEGRSISAIPPDKRPVNLMFQSYALFPHMSVMQNIAYGLEMDGLPKAQVKARVTDILEVIQLGHLAARKPAQLSGGQQQRVALARALVKRPKVLLLDEPLGALDKKLRSEMQLELKRLQAEFGITFIMVTHDQEEALVMADRVAIMQDGGLLQVGTPQEIYERPASRFAAGFIGVMNFLPVVIAQGVIMAQDTKIHANHTLPDGHAVAAIRPERLHVNGPGENAMSGEIAQIAYHGLDLLLHISTSLSDTPVIARMTADQADTLRPQIGAEITLNWAAKDTRIFPN